MFEDVDNGGAIIVAQLGREEFEHRHEGLSWVLHVVDDHVGEDLVLLELLLQSFDLLFIFTVLSILRQLLRLWQQ